MFDACIYRDEIPYGEQPSQQGKERSAKILLFVRRAHVGTIRTINVRLLIGRHASVSMEHHPRKESAIGRDCEICGPRDVFRLM